MKKYIVLLLLALWLAGCGASSQPAPQSFIASKSDGMALLTWITASQGSQSITGTYEMTTTQGTQKFALIGTQPDTTHVSLQIPDYGGEVLTGTINGAMLQTTGAGDAQTWYAGTAAQYGQLQALYRASLQVQSDLSQLEAIEGTPPNNSFPGYYQSALQGAQNRVKDEQASLTSIEQQSDPLMRCAALSAFSADFPPANQDQELQLPFSQPSDQGPQPVVNRSDLAQAITTLGNDAKQAAALPVPAIQGLPLPWKVESGPQLTQARQQLDALHRVVFAVAPQFPPLRSQAQQIQTQEAAIQQLHQCFG